MADNLSKQTYKNFEWIIIDDIGYDRTDIAQKYAKKYNLDIKLYPGKAREKNRTYGLINANNTVMEKSTGDLLVFLQDFILIPEDGLEQLATLHRKNPDALLAPVDMYVTPRIKPDIESEDWFHGETDVVGEFIRQNIRIRNLGLRSSTHPFDFEQNYGAIPLKIARELGGWYEFMDEGLGYDNTDIAYRALMKGYRLLVDETNVAVCIDHWDALKSNRENVLGRARRLNDPRYQWEVEMIEQGKLPLVRTQEEDDKIELLYEIPEDISDDDVVKWIREHGPEVVYKWLEEIKL
jgi:glycosyltransferase involved in cell wall biosynthesis